MNEINTALLLVASHQYVNPTLFLLIFLHSRSILIAYLSPILFFSFLSCVFSN